MLRLTHRNPYTDMPGRFPLQSGRDFVRHKCQSYAHPFQLYYEVLDMPLEEVEKLKALRVRQVKSNTELVRNLTIRLPPTATVGDLLEKVCDPVFPAHMHHLFGLAEFKQEQS